MFERLHRRAEEVDPRVEREKAEALAKTQGLSLAIGALLAVSAASILFLQSRDLRLALWLPITLLFNLLRWAALCAGRAKGRFALSPRTRLRLSTAGSLIAGLTWGYLPAALMDFHTVQAPFVSIILCGLTAGSALQGGAYAAPVAALSIPILLPMVARFTLLGTVVGDLLAFDVLLYLGMILRSSRGAEATFTRLARLRWEADAMAEDLKGRHEVARATAERLFQLANHDPLTGAANRAAFAQKLRSCLETASMDGGAVSLFLIDLDHFKAVNDTLGHGAGDEVLKAVASRLETHACQSRFVARLGGDEFAVLHCAAGDPESESLLADDFIAQVSAPLTVRGHPVNIGASVGVARYPDDAATSEELLARADLALYAAKYGGRQGWRRFDPSMLSAVERAREIERDLPSVLASGGLMVWFQPQVEVLGGRLTGLEALIRWDHPHLGWVPPPEIVAAAFRLRLSEALSRYVLERACAVTLQLDAAGFPQTQVAVNISPLEMEHYDLLAMVTETVAAHGIDPSRLELEITEEAVLANEEAIATLAALREGGVRLAMDDFGTGNSSIAYLRKLRMDRMKIDRSFIADLTTSDGDRALVQAIVSMGRSLGVEVLAEGVETVEQSLVLSSLGCHLAQGYLYGSALSETELAAYLTLESARRDGPVGRRTGSGHRRTA